MQITQLWKKVTGFTRYRISAKVGKKPYKVLKTVKGNGIIKYIAMNTGKKTYNFKLEGISKVGGKTIYTKLK